MGTTFTPSRIAATRSWSGLSNLEGLSRLFRCHTSTTTAKMTTTAATAPAIPPIATLLLGFRTLHQLTLCRRALQLAQAGGIMVEPREDALERCVPMGTKEQLFITPTEIRDTEQLSKLATCRRKLKGETWNRLCEEKLSEAVKALEVKVQQASYVPPSVFYKVLKRCIEHKDLDLGRRIHALILKSGHESNTYLANHIMRMYASHGGLHDVTQVFTMVPAPDSFMWYSIISAHAEHGHSAQAIKLYRQMCQTTVEPTNHVFVAALKACAAAADLKSGKEVHAKVLGNMNKPDIFVGNCLVDMYAKCGSLKDAREVFEKLHIKDVVTWNAMIGGYSRHGLGHEALTLYASMQHEGMTLADHVTFGSVLKACTRIGALDQGKQIHLQIQNRGLESDVLVGNCLVDMYAKCGSLKDARSVFDNMPTRDVVTWNTMIAGYAQHGLGEEALALYAAMLKGNIPASYITFTCLLKACGSIGALREGKQLHLQVQERGWDADVGMGNCLVDMYVRCGNLEDARRVFDSLSNQDLVTWNLMITGYLQRGLGQEALLLYESMQGQGKTPANSTTFSNLLKACVYTNSLLQGKLLHRDIQERGLLAELVVSNCLIDMYAKCGAVEDARRVFDNLPSRDPVAWNTMIAGYAQHGLGQDALTLYATMRQEGVKPSNHTFSSLLKACSTIGALHEGKQLHLQIQERGLEADVVVGSCLVDMYAKCGSLTDALTVFDNLPARNVVTWTAMIHGYARQGLSQKALALYKEMQQEGITTANHVTFACLLKACASVRDLPQGKQLHLHIQKTGLENDVIVGSSLVDMYAKCGSLEDANRLFERLPRKNVVTWNTMITGYAQHGLGEEALSLCARMQQEGMTPADQVTFVCLLKACASVGALHQGKELHLQIQKQGLEADVVIGSCLVDMYAKCGSLEEATRVFDILPTKNVVTWTAMINGYGQRNDSQKAMQAFQAMLQQGVAPDETTFLCLLVACSHEGLVDEGKRYFKMMEEEHGIKATVEHYNCLVDLLGRSGHLKEAEAMLLTMPYEDNVVGWMALLNACRSHGDRELGRLCFDKVISLEPQHSPAYALLVNIYADAGMWKDVYSIESMRKSAGSCKKPATACIEVNKRVEMFVVGEARNDISSKLKSVNVRLKEQGGYVPHTELVLKPVPDGQKEEALCGHAEKLALAYGLLNTPDGTTLLVTKNLRMCSDCHSGTKIMSKVERREIIVRDAHRVHHFVDGSCSCGDRH